ncbi:Ig-like domain repeat protein [Pendulispora albinea]|uniref:Ig-like domain repeat protein n=1 Tax=Pendulispora albinea TaxID=2741071 RepID=A0ABZ2LXU1_9BACT
MLRWLFGIVVGLGLWLVAGTAGAVETCPYGIDGEITPGVDPKETGRINQGFSATKCSDSSVPAPQVVGGQYGYDVYEFTNNTSQTCISVTLTAKPTPTPKYLFAVGYTGSFNPSAVTNNFAGYPLQPVANGESQTFEIKVNPLTNFSVVVNEADDGRGGQYRLDVAGCGKPLQVSSVEPLYCPVAGGLDVRVRGQGFETISGGTKVSFGGAASLNTIVVSDTEIVAVCPPHEAGTVNVVVTNPNTANVAFPGFVYWDKQNSNVSLMTTTVSSPTTATDRSVYGEGITFRATVRPDQPRFPTKLVHIRDNGVDIPNGTIALDPANGAGNITVADLGVGPHNFSLHYDGDEFFNPGDSNVVPFTINKADTTTTVSATSPSAPGARVDFQVTVNPNAPGTGVPSGNVTLRDTTTGTDLGTGVLANGVVTITSTPLSAPPEAHLIVAVYAGDDRFNGSTTNPPWTQLVKPVKTTVVLTADPPTSTTFGTTVRFTATVTSVAGTPTGTVTFADSLSAPATVTIDLTGGTAVWTAQNLSVGTRSIVATYNAVSPHETGTATIPYTVNKAATQVDVVAAPASPSAPDTAVTFTATVSSAVTTPVVAGSVEFKLNGTLIASKELDGNRKASVTTPRLAAGTYTLVVDFKAKADSPFANSTRTITHVVGSTGGDAGADAGDGGKDGGTDSGTGRPDSGGGTNDGGRPNGGGTTEGGGCDCNTTGAPGSGVMALVAGLGFAMMLVRRRRRAS